ncbi:MAG: DoxX family membrane protein [bacterium]|nr:DoxX family membrane protein [bacterium]MDZ4284420.1 DoxX family membrane protein [Patescibacteria group bacterium]
MLNPFPDLLDFALVAPALLRLTAGLIFLNLGVLKLHRERGRWMRSLTALRLKPARGLLILFAAIEIVGGALLLTGLLTQVAALVLALFLLAELVIELLAPDALARTLPFYLLLFAISLSLLFSGAGFFAFDLPL